MRRLSDSVLAPPPTIQADPAIVEASRHATMKTLVNPNGTLVLNCTFEYGLTETYGTKVPCNDPGFGEGPVSVGAEAVGLTPGTTYHYRVTATNEGGTTVGPDQTFQTLIDKAIPATGGASALQTTATLEGTINPLGNPLTACYFEYGSGSGYSGKEPCASLPGASRRAGFGQRPGRRADAQQQLPLSPGGGERRWHGIRGRPRSRPCRKRR